jgi:hypothetical protein
MSFLFLFFPFSLILTFPTLHADVERGSIVEWERNGAFSPEAYEEFRSREERGVLTALKRLPILILTLSCLIT